MEPSACSAEPDSQPQTLKPAPSPSAEPGILAADTSLAAASAAAKPKFVETATSSDATTADFQIAGSPAGRFSYNATATALLSGGTSQFSQDVFSYDLDLTYQLANRHIVAFSTNFGTIRGYYPQDEFDSSLTYRYQVWESLAFNASYRFRDVMNLDPNLTSGQYRASGLSFTLAFNFFR